jgi:hypothetical protein
MNKYIVAHELLKNYAASAVTNSLIALNSKDEHYETN